MTGDPTPRRAALAAAPLLLLLQGCLLDIRPGGMNPPGTPVDTQSDEPAVETEVDDDFIAPDPDVPDLPDDVAPCDVVCADGWTAACNGSTVWCVSPYQGTGNCCTAFDVCQGFDGAFPGFWPTAGPYDFRPQEFSGQMELPEITIVYSGYSGPDVVASLACFDSLGGKEDGELHTVEVATDCATANCGSWIKSASCSGDPVGCGPTCSSYPIWCVSY
jgi:hypothetical protein